MSKMRMCLLLAALSAGACANKREPEPVEAPESTGAERPEPVDDSVLDESDETPPAPPE